MSSPDLHALSAHFGYPPIIGELLEELVAAARRRLGPCGLRSVLVGGSLPRGEMSWVEEGGRVELLSDIDAALFVRRRDAEREARLREDIAAIEAAVDARSPLFHMDAGVHRLFMKRPTIWTYEMRMGALCLDGEDLRRLLPRVTHRNLDRGNTAELVLVRLWNQLLYTPRSVVEGRTDGFDETVFAYVTARNTLELPTILLPQHGILRPGYAARHAYLRAHGSPAAAFDSAFVRFVGEALACKRHPSAGGAPGRALATMLDYYGRLLVHLARLADPGLPGADGLDPQDDRYDCGINAAYQEAPVLRLRRRALETRLRWKRRRSGDRAAARGYGRVRATRFLLALHRALAEQLAGGPTPSLPVAARLARSMGYDGPADWQAMRTWFIRLHGEVLFKGNRAKIDKLVAMTSSA